MTQPNDELPKDAKNLVDLRIVTRVILGASKDVSDIDDYIKNVEKTEPYMATMLSKYLDDVVGTFTSEDVVTSTEHKTKIRNALKKAFTVGFRTGGENMRKFYGEALEGLIKPPHGYNDEDFK